jgi:N-acetylmuramic acid 6-phosphate (MurNAc-6-P) etherase
MLVFAQEALFKNASDAEPGGNYNILCQAARMDGVSAVGSAPYVEPTTEQAKKNIAMIFEVAMNSGNGSRHIDFHLDYNLNPAAKPLIYEVIALAKTRFASSPEEKMSRAR